MIVQELSSPGGGLCSLSALNFWDNMYINLQLTAWMDCSDPSNAMTIFCSLGFRGFG